MPVVAISSEEKRRTALNRVRAFSFFAAFIGFLGLASPAGAQTFNDLIQGSALEGVGWSGFWDVEFLLDAFLNLILAAALGVVIGYHPRRVRTADTLEEIEAPKVSIVYAVIGSLIGILVMEYGMGVGFVLFGFGALIRFRTVMRSPQLTGQVIFVSLIGLTCGLELPHVAVLATAFGYVLTYFLEARITYRVDVRGLPPERFAEAADAYRSALAEQHYRVLSETKRPEKNHVCFIFRSSGRETRRHIESLFDEKIDVSLRGSLDWEVD
jgi:hypothetical protein